MRLTALLFTGIFVFGCAKKPETAQEIIDHTIEAYGGSMVYKTDIEFDFRDIHYRAYNNEGMISYERMFEDDSLGSIHDVMDNSGFVRNVNGEAVTLDNEWRGKYQRSVNSVVYFMRIPFNLNDPAVIKKRLEDVVIRGKEYYKVYVTFQQEGGGEDHTDEFIYWIGKQDLSIDYFCYLYHTDGGGKRFREMLNPRVIDGIRFVDYINYEPKDINIPLEEYDQYFENGGFEELSRIENRNIEVTILD